MRRTRLNQFFKAGDKAYGIANNNAAFTNYSGATIPTRPTLFDTTEYIGRNSFAEGDVVDKEKVAVVFPVSKKEAVAKFYENNNAGNIKKGTFGGQTWGGKTYEGKKTGIKYRKYDSKEQGLADIINVIQNYKTNDLKKIMSKYASDDESGKVYSKYFEDVKKAIGSDKINFKDNEQIKNLMKVITTVENKSNSVPPALYYKEEDFDKAVDLYREVNNEETSLPIRKPSKEEMTRLGFRYGGGADSGAGASGMGSAGMGSTGMGSAGMGSAGARDGGNPGGHNKDKSNNSKQGQTPGGPGKGRKSSKVAQKSPSTTSTNTPSSRPTMANISGPTKKTSGNFLGNLKKQGQNLLSIPTKKVAPKTKTVISKATKVGYDLFNTALRNKISTLNPFDPRTTFNTDYSKLINEQDLALKSTPVGLFSLKRKTEYGLPLNSITDIAKPDITYSGNLIGNKYGVDYGVSITDEGDAYAGASTNYKNIDINAAASYEDGEKNFNVRATYDFKKGGLLDRKRFKKA